jgi:putative transposase
MICPRERPPHAPTSPLYCSVQIADHARSPHPLEACGQSLPRVSTPTRSAQSLKGRLRAAGSADGPGRRARTADGAAYRRAGAPGRPPDCRAGCCKKSYAALSREQKLQITEQLGRAYPLVAVCRILELPRSSVYARQSLGPPRGAQEVALRREIEQIAARSPMYGYRLVTVQLRWEGEPANSKRVRRLMGELSTRGNAPERRCRTTNSDHPYPCSPNLVAELEKVQPDHVSVAAITYVHLRADVVYLAVQMGVYIRAIRGRGLACQLDQALTLRALERAVATGHAPAMYHAGQGVQYAATSYVARPEQLGEQISLAQQGEPRQNRYAERLMRSIKEKEVQLSEYRVFADAHAQFRRYLDEVYHLKRIHLALGYLTPAEFEAAHQADHLRPLVILCEGTFSCPDSWA